MDYELERKDGFVKLMIVVESSTHGVASDRGRGRLCRLKRLIGRHEIEYQRRSTILPVTND